jgi:hypothetical protein
MLDGNPALKLDRSDAGSDRAANHDRSLQKVRGRYRLSTLRRRHRRNDLSGYELDFSGRLSDRKDSTDRFDVVTDENRGEKLDLFIRAEESFVAVQTNQEFRSDVSEKLKHLCAVDEPASVMTVMGAHSKSDHNFSGRVDSGIGL